MAILQMIYRLAEKAMSLIVNPTREVLQMRKLSIVLLVLSLGLLLASTASAKEAAYNAGNIFLSGATDLNLAFGTDTVKPKDGDSQDTSHTVFGLGTRVGYFVINGLEVGLGLDYNYDKASTDIPTTDPTTGATEKIKTDTTTSDYLFGIQGAYFFDLGGTDPFIALLLGLGGNSNDVKPDKGDKTTNSASGMAYDISVGVNFLLNKRVGLAPALFYTGDSFSGSYKVGSGTAADYDTTSSRMGLRVGIDLFL